jgi:hypothetical protein
LLASSDETDRHRLVSCLRELRNLIEQNAQPDVAGILGEL